MPPKTISLEPPDRALIRKLQQDCRLTNQQLAEETHMSTSSCWRRVQSLEASGVIEGYVARVNPARAGLDFAAMVQVSLTRHSADAVQNFVREVRARAEVLQCFALTGDSDYVLRVVTADLPSYNAFLNDYLFSLPGVSKVSTSVVMETIKDSTSLPL